ncbi:MAG: sugar transferase [Alphaproteobacteria bacterium]|nr:sugar transferase [Alphaproteobacteria bacterium]
MELAPIVLFVYNRLSHTKQTVEALQNNILAKQSNLYIFSDGPKKESVEEVNTVRAYIKKISGFKSVTIYESQYNKGLANSIIDGVTQIIDKYGKIIVLEDDLITNQWFLIFMNEALDKYEKQNEIFMIGGHNVKLKVPFWYKKDYYLAHRSCSWGWATWRNRWIKADWEMKEYNSFINNESEVKRFNRIGSDATPMLKKQMDGKIDSWAIRWEFCMFKHNAYCLRPIYTLITNIGLDGTGIHCGKTDPSAITYKTYDSDSYDIRLPNKAQKCKTLEDNFKKFQDRNIIAHEKELRKKRNSHIIMIITHPRYIAGWLKRKILNQLHH